MKKIYFFSILIILLSGCLNKIGEEDCNEKIENNEVVEVTDKKITKEFLDLMVKNSENIYCNNTQEEIDKNIREIAPLFAAALNVDPNVKSSISRAISSASYNISQDDEVFYELIKNDKNISKGINKAISLTNKTSTEKLNELAENIPYFSVYIYNLEKISTSSDELWVIPIQYANDEESLDKIIAYNKNGETREFSADEAPDFPVVVLGISERISTMYNELSDDFNQISRKKSLTDWDGSIVHGVKLYGIKIDNDMEPWFKGRAEFYAVWAIQGRAVRQDYSNVDRKNRWYGKNDLIFDIDNTPQHQFYAVEAWEEDGGSRHTTSIDASWNYKSVDVKMHEEYEIKSHDDHYGSTSIYFGHPKNSNGYQEYSAGGAHFRLGYNEYTK